MAVRLTFNTLLPMLYLYFRLMYLFHVIPSSCLSSRPFTGPLQSLSYCIEALILSSILTSALPPPFFDTYSLSKISLGCKTLFIIKSFLVLWSICLSFSLVHFMNGPRYLRKGTAKTFIPLMRFLLYSLVSSSFLVLLRYSFLNFFHLYLFDSICFQYSQIFLSFLFSEHTDLFLVK